MSAWPKLLTLTGLALLQQIGSVDLSRPRIVSHKPPAGCESVKPGVIGDGWPEPEDHKPRQIEVAVVSVSDSKPPLDGEVEAVVQLRNTDTHAIQIPWSTDPIVTEEGQNEESRQWEGGTFEFFLKDNERHQVMLKGQPNGSTAPNSLEGVCSPLNLAKVFPRWSNSKWKTYTRLSHCD